MAALVKSARCILSDKLHYFGLCSIQDGVKFVSPLASHIKNVRFGSTKTEDAELIEQASLYEELEPVTEDQTEYLERIRDKSRLRPQHRNMLFDKIPYDEGQAWYHDTVKYKRKMYARYGEETGINPGIMWPTHAELLDTKEIESVAYPETLQEVIAKNAATKKKELAHLKAREDEIVKKIAKLEQWKADVRNKIEKKTADSQAAKDRKDRLVEEVRRHFGFKVDPREDRFKEMLETKEKAERKLMKEAKKKEKEAKMIAKLTAKSESLPEQKIT